jgi:quinol-cytochrome oxidoreductase complex cytochrome b subunit
MTNSSQDSAYVPAKYKPGPDLPISPHVRPITILGRQVLTVDVPFGSMPSASQLLNIAPCWYFLFGIGNPIVSVTTSRSLQLQISYCCMLLFCIVPALFSVPELLQSRIKMIHGHILLLSEELNHKF